MRDEGQPRYEAIQVVHLLRGVLLEVDRGGDPLPDTVVDALRSGEDLPYGKGVIVSSRRDGRRRRKGHHYGRDDKGANDGKWEDE